MATVKDERGELLVAGYVRNIEKVYKILNIPIEINDIIYLYQRLYDEWSREYASEKITIDETGSIVKINRTGHATVPAFGSHIVTQDAFKWRIKMKVFTYDKNKDGSPPYIGIVEDVKELKESINSKKMSTWTKFAYLLCGKTGRVIFHHAIGIDDCGCRWNKKDDILEMTLDLNKQTLSFKVNDKNGAIVKNVKKAKYRLVLGCYKSEGSEFVLL